MQWVCARDAARGRVVAHRSEGRFITFRRRRQEAGRVAPTPKPLAKGQLVKSRSFSSFNEEPPTTCAAAEPCEVLSWDVDALVEFLRKKRDVRLCVNALIATAKLESYMHLDPTNERTKW